ncbi:hypothetical protein NCC49_004136 [Naganishia albida]|nr:hypothetical protein NCC49_004136 [Naganishia albida]
MAASNKGKAGGPGKKGKKFVEDKSALLSLIGSLPKVQKESADELVASEALSAKGKSKSSAEEDEQMDVTPAVVEFEDTGRGAKGKQQSAKTQDGVPKTSKNRQRTKAKNRALLDTKRAIIAKTKEVKKQKKEAKKPASQRASTTDPDVKPKRRVGFAL